MTRDCWEDFAASGRVSDYLKYREQKSHTPSDPGALAVWTGGVEHGSENRPDRYCIVRNACR